MNAHQPQEDTGPVEVVVPSTEEQVIGPSEAAAFRSTRGQEVSTASNGVHLRAKEILAHFKLS